MSDRKPRCKKCGRLLTDPVSIAAGMGPECRGQRKTARIRRPGRHTTGRAYQVEASVCTQTLAVGTAAAPPEDDLEQMPNHPYWWERCQEDAGILRQILGAEPAGALAHRFITPEITYLELHRRLSSECVRQANPTNS